MAEGFLKSAVKFDELIDDMEKYELYEFMIALSMVASELYYRVLRLPNVKLESYYGRDLLKKLRGRHSLRFELEISAKFKDTPNKTGSREKHSCPKKEVIRQRIEKFIHYVHFTDTCVDLNKASRFYRLPDNYNLKPYAFYHMKQDFLVHWHYHITYIISGINKWLSENLFYALNDEEGDLGNDECGFLQTSGNFSKKPISGRRL